MTGVLCAFDDYPIHQTSKPIAQTASPDLNHYDRYFFNGYTADASIYFGAAMGLYPNREVADAAFSVVHNGEQISVFASCKADPDRSKVNTVGPIEVRIIEPLRVIRLIVNAPEHGLTADLTFRNRTPALEEPPFYLRRGTKVLFDYTRLTQMGSWEGWIEVDGMRMECNPSDVIGSRDRSWGSRGVGQQPPAPPPTEAPQFFWLWGPTNFADLAVHFDVNDYANGRRWHEIGAVCAAGSGGTDNHSAEWDVVESIDYQIQWRPGTRRMEQFSVTFQHGDNATSTLSFEPLLDFQMKGIGYLHPTWGHGMWIAPLAVGGERYSLPVTNVLQHDHVHVQALSRATYVDRFGETHIGTGVLEQLALGSHEPSGLTGILDGYLPAGA